ncbi:MAG: ASCH domain-containing protein [Clostridia bacterium]|nr:ASCH domain-containing protein [Clostridia bacterium]MDD4375818.1 ASCH domain-containing protein [Clostridia bacterium]
MKHEMKLQPKYFDFILNGTKRIELRLNDEKRQIIKVGDIIKFIKEPELTESFEAKVIGLLNYSSFNELFKDFDISTLADSSMTKDELINVLQEFYTPEKQSKFGVLGIKLEII